MKSAMSDRWRGSTPMPYAPNTADTWRRRAAGCGGGGQVMKQSARGGGGLVAGSLSRRPSCAAHLLDDGGAAGQYSTTTPTRKAKQALLQPGLTSLTMVARQASTPYAASMAAGLLVDRRCTSTRSWLGHTPRTLMPSVCSVCCPPAPASSV